MREEKRLHVFENKVLRKIFGPKRDDEIGECRRLHNGELHDLYGLCPCGHEPTGSMVPVS